MSLKNVSTLLGAGELPAFFPESPSKMQGSSNLQSPNWLDKMSPGPPAHWKKGRAVGRHIQTSETVHLSVVNGFGRVVYPDSSVYVGSMKNRARDGEGCFRYADGGEYLGQWMGGKKHGIGVMIFPSGARYSGEWRNGMRHGYGRYDWRPLAEEQQQLRSPSNLATFHDAYVGQWENDKMSGLGRLDSANESLEIGNFANGKMHGYGMRILKSRPQAVSAASLLSGRAVFGARQVFVGYFEDDSFVGIRSKEEEEEFQKIQSTKLDKPLDLFAKKATKNTGQTNTPSPKRFPAMSESDFDPKVADDVAVCSFPN
jgi:hypothetical protein